MAYNFNPNFSKHFNTNKSNYKYIVNNGEKNPYSNPGNFEMNNNDNHRYHNFTFLNKNNFEEGMYRLDDLDNPNGWDFKHLDILGEMNFIIEDDYKMCTEIEIPSLEMENEKIKASVYKTNEGYVLETTRKYVFETFNKMLEYIDSTPLNQY